MCTIAQRGKRPRKAKSLTPISYPKTTKDRVRWLRDRNEVLKDNYYNFKALRRRLEDIGNTAEERLSWAREKIFGFWRGDDSKPGATAVQSDTLRFRRVGPKMDGKWWFWNLAFATAPAILLALYCELIGKPEMQEMNRRMHIAKMKEQYGDNYRQDEDEELKQIMRDSSTLLSTRLYKAATELALYAWTRQIPTTSTPSTVAKDSSKGDNTELPATKPMDRLQHEIAAMKHGSPKEKQSEKQTVDPPRSPIHQRVLLQQRKDTTDDASNPKGNLAWEHFLETVKHYYGVLSRKFGQ